MQVTKQTNVVIIKGYADPTKSIFFSAKTWILSMTTFLAVGLYVIAHMG